MLVFKSKLNRAIALILVFLTAGFITQLQSTPAQASHLRGSLVTVEYHVADGTNPDEVHVVATTLARKGSSAGMGYVTVYFVDNGTPQQLNTCSGQSPVSSVADTTNPLFEIQVDTFTITDCFATPGDYIFESSTGARISGILNTTNSNVQFESMIHIDGIHDSSAPIYNSGYMYNIAYDANLTYSTNLGGLGQGNTPVTYSLVTSAAYGLGGYGANQVPCSNLNTSTGQYQIGSTYCTGTDTIASAFGGGAKYYSLKVKASDATGQYSTRDVLLYFNTTTNQSPAFTSVPASGAFTVSPGSTATAQFCAQDPDVADVLNFTFSPTRSWITASAVTPVSPATTPNTYCVTFTLAPPAGTSEAFNFEVSVYDNNNSFVRSASNLYSFQVGATLPSTNAPSISYAPTSVSAESGAAVTVAAPSSNGTAVVSYSINPALPSGLTLDPSTGAISGSTTVVGTTTYTITATDAQNVTGTATITIEITGASVYVPTGPAITSISPRKITVGQAQTVTISGERLNGATKLIVRGTSIVIKSNDFSTIVFELSAQDKAGSIDITFETPQGNVTFYDALTIVEAANANIDSSSANGATVTNVRGFAAGSSTLTASIKKRLVALAATSQTVKSITCVGYTMGPTVLPSDALLGKARATATCNFLKALLPASVTTAIRTAADTAVGAQVRRVEIRASK